MPLGGTGRLRLVAHPRAFEPKRIKERNAGAPFSLEDAKERFNLQLTREPVKVSPTVTFLGEIPRRTDFEGAPLGEALRDGEWRPDDLADDSALACRTPEGLVIVTGCSHSGICNIVEHAKDVMKDSRIRAVIGGFHLRALGPQLDRTAEYFAGLDPRPELYPCHCTCFDAKHALAERLPVHEVGSGLRFEW